MEEKTLKEKTFSGLSWSAADKLFQQLFVFVSGVILARILDKEYFGLMGTLAIFTGMANLLQDSGFGTALIRKKNTNHDDYKTVFYTNVLISIIIYAILFFTAPIISRYYEQPILTPLARFLFLSFLFNSFAVVQNAILLKEVNYKLTTKINLTAVIISYSISLLLAFLGFGVWALATQIVLLSFCRTCGFWIWGRWKLSGTFSMEILKELYSFSSKLIVANLINSFSTNIPQNIIAKQYSFGITGLYNQANKLYNTVTDFLTGTIFSVPFTVLSQIEENERLKNAIRKFVRARAFLFFPLFMGMILVAEPFIVSLLGKKWEDAVPILQLLSFGGLFYSLDSTNNDLLRVKGKSGTILILDMIRNLFLFITIIATIVFKYDYLYLVAGLSASYIIRYAAGSYCTAKAINYRGGELIKDSLPYAITSIVAIACGYSLKYIIDNNLLLLICQIISVSFIYITILYVTGSVLVREAIKIALDKTPLRRK